jgi:hypothetical protein
MNRIGHWMSVVGATIACGACSHSMHTAQTSTMGGDVAATGNMYTVQLWSGNKKAQVPFPTQPVNTSLRWAEADEGVIHWNEGFASNTQAKRTVRIDHPHGALHAVQVSLDRDPAGTGPALVIDSVSVSSSSATYVCAGTSPVQIQPGALSELVCSHR